MRRQLQCRVGFEAWGRRVGFVVHNEGLGDIYGCSGFFEHDVLGKNIGEVLFNFFSILVEVQAQPFVSIEHKNELLLR